MPLSRSTQNHPKGHFRPLLWSRICYNLYGPTSLHLQHELGLFITQCFLTTASLLGLYRTTFGTKGDYAYLLLSAMWLSRHFVFRFIATTTTTTATSFHFHTLGISVRGVLLRFFLLAACPGHCFDISSIQGLNNASFKSWGLINVLDMSGQATPSFNNGTTNHHHLKNRFSHKHRWIVLRNAVLIPMTFLLTGFRSIYIWVGKAIGVELLSTFTSSHHHRHTTDLYSDTLPLPSSSNHSNTHKKHERRTSLDHKGPTTNKAHHHSQNHNHSNSLGPDFFSSLDTNHSTSGTTTATTATITSIFYQLYPPSFQDASLVLDRIVERIPSTSFCFLLVCILWLLVFIIYILPLADEYLSGSKHLYYGLSVPWDRSMNEFHKNFFSTRLPHYTQSQHHKTAQRQIIDYVNRISLYDRLEKTQEEKRLHFMSTSFVSVLRLQWTSITVMLTMIACVGTMVCIILFGSILPPLPDLMISPYYGTNLFTRIGHVYSTMKSIKSNTKQATEKGSNMDTFKMDTCLLMHFKIILLRVLESSFVCVILPHTRYVCKYTGHCYKDPMIWEVDGIMGITGVQGKDMFSSINCDCFTYVLILCTVCFVTSLTLMAQMLTLDRGHLVTYALQSLNVLTGGDHANAQGSRKGPNSGQKGSNNSTDDWYTPPSSVSKRGLFAELMKFMQSFMEWFSKRLQQILSDETRHISSSRTIAIFSQLHALYAIFLIIVCLMQLIAGKTSFSLMLVFIAIFNSAGCMDIGLHNMDELNDLAEEIKM